MSDFWFYKYRWWLQVLYTKVRMRITHSVFWQITKNIKIQYTKVGLIATTRTIILDQTSLYHYLNIWSHSYSKIELSKSSRRYPVLGCPGTFFKREILETTHTVKLESRFDHVFISTIKLYQCIRCKYCRYFGSNSSLRKWLILVNTFVQV